MSRSRPRLPSWAPYAVAGAWLLLGWLWLVRGAGHPGVPYRPWAFDHHAYSDLLAMGGDRYFNGGRPVPYLEDPIEYPPLLGLAIWAASFAPGGPAGYFTAGYLLLALCCFGSIALLSRIPGASPWWFAASPALAYYSGLNWDHLPILLMLAALLALGQERFSRAGAATALGASAKLLPVALLPAALGALLRAGRGRAIAAAAVAGAGVLLLVNAPVAAAAPAGWARFWRYNAGRSAENSVWEALRHLPGAAHLAADPPFLNAASGALLAAAAAFAAWGAFRAGPGAGARAVPLGTGLVLVAWITFNKVWSPQYFLYAFAAAALVSAPRWMFGPLTAMAVLDYHVAFEARASRGLVPFHGALYTGEEIARTLLLALLLGWMGRALWRSRRDER